MNLGEPDALRKVWIRIDPYFDMGNLRRTADKLADALIFLKCQFPTRGQVLYMCLNKPWELQNWQALPTAPTRRTQRRWRGDLEHRQHVRWARDLLEGKY